MSLLVYVEVLKSVPKCKFCSYLCVQWIEWSSLLIDSSRSLSLPEWEFKSSVLTEWMFCGPVLVEWQFWLFWPVTIFVEWEVGCCFKSVMGYFIPWYSPNNYYCTCQFYKSGFTYCSGEMLEHCRQDERVSWVLELHIIEGLRWWLLCLCTI